VNVALPADGSIPAFLDRRKLVYTYTMLQAYRNCGHAMYRRYVKKDIPYVETKEMAWGNSVHSAFENRVGSQVPLPEAMRQWEGFAAQLDGRGAAVEQKLGITQEGRPTGFWDKDCWLRGKVDVAMRQDSRAYLLDWKTGGSKFEDPFELEIGALLLKAKYPEITVIKGHYIWLKENRQGQAFDLSRFGDTWKEINKIVTKIEADRALNEFEKRQSGLCSWCDVRDCENNRKPA